LKKTTFHRKNIKIGKQNIRQKPYILRFLANSFQT